MWRAHSTGCRLRSRSAGESWRPVPAPCHRRSPCLRPVRLVRGGLVGRLGQRRGLGALGGGDFFVLGGFFPFSGKARIFRGPGGSGCLGLLGGLRALGGQARLFIRRSLGLLGGGETRFFGDRLVALDLGKVGVESARVIVDEDVPGRFGADTLGQFVVAAGFGPRRIRRCRRRRRRCRLAAGQAPGPARHRCRRASRRRTAPAGCWWP